MSLIRMAITLYNNDYNCNINISYMGISKRHISKLDILKGISFFLLNWQEFLLFTIRQLVRLILLMFYMDQDQEIKNKINYIFLDHYKQITEKKLIKKTILCFF